MSTRARSVPAAVAVALAALVAALLTVAAPASGSPAAKHTPRKPWLTLSRSTVAQNDPVTLSGTSTLRQVAIYRKLKGEPWRRIGTARVHSGRFRYTTRPAIGRTAAYRASAARTGTTHVSYVRSARCDPLPAHGSTSAWFQDMTRDSALSVDWARMICSAAPGSTITVAEMFVYDNSPLVSRLMDSLAIMHAYRGVHVRVLVQRQGYYSNAQWASLRRHFSFAELHSCLRGCHSNNPTAHAHTKFTTVSKTIFGGPAVLESSANWALSQLEEHRQSGIYVYGNKRLLHAYDGEWTALSTGSALAPGLWHSAGGGIWYSFDPHPAPTDPIASDLASLTCRPGDSIGIGGTVLTRAALVTQLNRLSGEGCTVRAVIDPSGATARSATFAIRPAVLHDKFLVVSAHLRSTGARVDEVIHGSENFTTGSLTLSDQQLVIVRLPAVWSAYRGWFGHLWSVAGTAPPTGPTGPPVDPDVSIGADAADDG